MADKKFVTSAQKTLAIITYIGKFKAIIITQENIEALRVLYVILGIKTQTKLQ